ncbi:hypothetical protein F5887DRAFT_1085304 [Amanita rubescens]|nr:hypothetical protein F5887DRAFT_1085304 [Amanita rubescens]
MPPYAPLETASESGFQTDDQVDELASDGEECQQSDHEQSTSPTHERSFSIESRLPEHIERVVEATLSNMDAVLQSAAGKTDLPAEYFIWKWNAQMAARLVEGKDGGHGVSLASFSGGGGPQGAALEECLANYVHQALATPITPRRQGTRDSNLEAELRALLIKRANEAAIPACESRGFQWSKLLDILAGNGYYLDNYPYIALPGATGKKMGIRGLSAKEMHTLLDALRSSNHRCEFKPYKSQSLRDIEELVESDVPVLIRAPPKDSSRRSERFYLDGSKDFEGHEMCMEHRECRDEQSITEPEDEKQAGTSRNRWSLASPELPRPRLSQEELGDVPMGPMPKTLSADGEHSEGNISPVAKRQKTKLK